MRDRIVIGRGGRRRVRAVLALLCCALVLTGAAPADWKSQVQQIAAPYRFSWVGWHLRQFAELFTPVRVPVEASEAPERYVIEFYDQLSAARALKDTPDGVPADLRASLDEMRPVVERILATEVRQAFREQGIYGPADRLVRIPLTVPPVWFALEAPPHILVISPRDRIASIHQEVLAQSMDLATREAIEDQVTGLDLSGLVTEIGGIGATYPAMVSDDSSLHYTIETVAEEWLHQYLAFTPLGSRYVLHLLGLRDDYAIAQINESLAGIVRDEIADAVWQEHYAALVTSSDSGSSGQSADTFDFRAFMRETRVHTDELLAADEIDEAEAYMEAQRQELVTHGYHIRKLNQAYFAFNGTYADAPGSTTPIGDELRALRGTCSTLSEYLDIAVTIRSQQDLLDLLTARGVGTALAPTSTTAP